MTKKPIAIVTGGAGFIGSHMVDLLIEDNFEVRVIDDLSGGHLENLNQHKNILYYRDQDNDSFINAIITSNKNNEEIQIGYLETMDSRVKNIINFIT